MTTELAQQRSDIKALFTSIHECVSELAEMAEVWHGDADAFVTLSPENSVPTYLHAVRLYVAAVTLQHAVNNCTTTFSTEVLPVQSALAEMRFQARQCAVEGSK